MRRVWHVVLLTSAAWFLLDVIILFYFVDYVKNTPEQRFVRTGGEAEGPVRERERAVTSPPAETDPPELASILKDLRFDAAGPGQLGKGVKLGSEDDELKKKKFGENQFNLLASDRMSINRTLPDVRHAKCRSQRYDVNGLPQTSVVIVFHNEAFSTLLRSIHSVINRSPPQLLKELVLIDDASDRPHLKKPLDAYLRRHIRVPHTLRHLPKRSGLVNARLIGASLATGPTLTFLDAHIEVTTGWLEPLLQRVHADSTVAACPVIDVISDDTFEYVPASDRTWGGFNWKLQFRWYSTGDRGADSWKPLKTPTMAGGLFTISKDNFYKMGSYDQGMQVWGGENLEMSFRTWMCGGKIEIIPCSHVGHVFRKQTPYTFPGGTSNVIHRNALRTAHVWMDEYKEFYFKIMPGVRSLQYGDVSDRLKLRKDLNCKSFAWYLKEIYPQSHLPLRYHSLGFVRNPNSKMCLDTMGKKEGNPVGLSQCHDMGGNQAWSLTENGELRSDEVCLEVSGFATSSLKMAKCHKRKGNQQWEFQEDTGHLHHVSSDKCLGISTSGKDPELSACRPIDPTQSCLYLQTGHLHHVSSDKCLGISTSGKDPELSACRPIDPTQSCLYLQTGHLHHVSSDKCLGISTSGKDPELSACRPIDPTQSCLYLQTGHLHHVSSDKCLGISTSGKDPELSACRPIDPTQSCLYLQTGHLHHVSSDKCLGISTSGKDPELSACRPIDPTQSCLYLQTGHLHHVSSDKCLGISTSGKDPELSACRPIDPTQSCLYLQTGHLHHVSSDKCLGISTSGKDPELSACRPINPTQSCLYLQTGHLHHVSSDKCLGISTSGKDPELSACRPINPTQSCLYLQTGHLHHVSSDKCLGISTSGKDPELSACRPIDPTQSWVLQDYSAVAHAPGAS